MIASEPVPWRVAMAQRPVRVAWAIAAVVAVPMVVLLPRFFAFIEAYPGTRPWDPLLPLIPPADVSIWVFGILYGTLLFTIVRIARRPLLVLRGVHAYLIMMLFRIACIRTFVLEPPPDIVPLIDPIIQVFYPGKTPFLKDLFFSGHTATMALLIPLARGRAVRLFTVLATCAIGALVLVQHAHWTIDVVAAPVVVWIAWRLSRFSLSACGVAAA